jgi:hypothetical protein
MGSDQRSGSFFQGILRRLPGRAAKTPEPAWTPLAVLEELHAESHRDYCLYLRPALPYRFGAAEGRSGTLLSPDVEDLLVRAFAPLPLLTIDEFTPDRDAPLPGEAFVTLAESARVLFLVPMTDTQFLKRLKLLQESGSLSRCIFLMPEKGTLERQDWSEPWEAARVAAAQLGIELSPYTAGGWLFRLDSSGKACTFRPIANPNSEKIARALEAICGQME